MDHKFIKKWRIVAERDQEGRRDVVSTHDYDVGIEKYH